MFSTWPVCCGTDSLANWMRTCGTFLYTALPCISVNASLHSGIELICFPFAPGCKLQAAQFCCPVFASWSPPLCYPHPQLATSESRLRVMWLAGFVWCDPGTVAWTLLLLLRGRVWRVKAPRTHEKRGGKTVSSGHSLSAAQVWTLWLWQLASKNNHGDDAEWVNVYWELNPQNCATPVHAFHNILFTTLGPYEISLLCPFHRWRNQDPRCEIMSPMSPIRTKASKPVSDSRTYVLNNSFIWPPQILMLLGAYLKTDVFPSVNSTIAWKWWGWGVDF